MAFKIVVADPKTGRSYKLEAKDSEVSKFIGMRIGEKFEGRAVGLLGYELQITGGTDRDGFPMRPDIAGSGRTNVLLARGPGFYPRKLGERRRKMVRGCRVSEDIIQLNAVITKWGEKPIEELIQHQEIKQT
ncbi:MAG: 30S ribosomal protein S6e [Candidatus Hadarchaeaceae archaeon]